MESDIAVIGAGIVGLAVASAVAKEDREVFVLEKSTASERLERSLVFFYSKNILQCSHKL